MRICSVIAATAVAVGCVATATAASAAPAGSPSASTAGFDCGQAGTFTGLANSGNSQALTWNAFFLTGANGGRYMLTPTANDLVVTYNGTVVFAPNATKGSAPGSVTCSVSGGGGALVIGGSVTGVLVAA